MKLTKQQIQYIDDYLRKSGVIYWDVRMELLDHFVVAIEEKITKEALSFEEALKEITISFGNDIKQGYVLNSDNTKWIKSTKYTTGEGFEKLQREKQRYIGKKHFKAFWRQVVSMFLSVKFYIEYILMIASVIVISKYSEKWALTIGFLYLFYPFFVIIYKSIKGETPKKSLHINMAMTGVFLWINLFGLVPNIYKSFYDEKMEFQLVVWMLILLFPFIKASFVRYHKVCEEFKKHYDLIL
jgi:cation transport ATPase